MKCFWPARFPFFSPTLLRACGLLALCLFPESGSAARYYRREDFAAQAERDMENCLAVNQKEKELSPFLAKDSGPLLSGKLRREWNATENSALCAHNAGGYDQNGALNNILLQQSGLLWQSRIKGVDESLAYVGLCKFSYRAGIGAFTDFATLKEKVCRNLKDQYQSVKDCIGSEDCKRRWEKLKALAEKAETDFAAMKDKVPDYLENVIHQLDSLDKKYEEDRARIAERASMPPPVGSLEKAAAPGEALEGICAAGAAEATRGGKLHCRDYIAALTNLPPALIQENPAAIGASAPGALQNEESRARQNLIDFRRQYIMVLSDWIDRFQALSLKYDAAIASYDRTESDKGYGKIFNPTNAAAATQLGGQVFNQPGSGITTSSPLPGLTAIAAGVTAAGAGISGSRFASAGASSAGPARAPAEAASPAPPAAPFSPGNTPFGGELGGARDSLNRGPTPHASPQAEDGVKVVAAEPGIFQQPTTAGASRPLAGKAAPPAKAEGGRSPAGSPDAGRPPEEMPGAFTPALDPRSSGKPATSVGGEVANLLGQMKSLFNLDDPGAMGAGGPGAPPPANPAPESGNQEIAAADATTATPAEEAPAGELASPAMRLASSAGESPLGTLDKSLFSRIRLRHIRCMEKGLVLYGLRERVE